MADLDWQSTGWGIKMANLLCCKLNLEMQDMLESVSFRHISKTSNTCVDFFTHAKLHYVDFLVSTTHGTDVLCLCTNSASWCSTACMIKRLRTSWNCANQSQVSHHGNIFDPPPNSSWSYRVTYGRRDFCVAGPSVWNSLPDSLRNPIIGGNSFRQSLKSEDVSVRNVLMHSAH